MAIKVRIEKSVGRFKLDVGFQTESRRIGILGASGCGKSMTLKCIAGIETPDQGSIVIDERVLYDRNVNIKPQKRKVGYLFQNYALFPTMTVEDNIGAGLKGKKEEKKQMISKMIEKFRLEGLRDRLPGELSGGQQQRVALARIMAYEPEVILLDEPFSALDEFLKDRLQQELMQMLEDYGGTVILVSHSRDEIYRFSEELIIMDEGKTICQGKTKEIFANPEWKEAARLTGCKNITEAKRIDRHHVSVPAWGVTLILRKEVPEGLHWIGVRAHDFIPIWKKAGEEKLQRDESSENRILLVTDSVAELPFEKKYFLKTAYETEHICWFVQREQWDLLDERGMPDYLEIPEEKILLLQ
ncbi:MAG: ATP-binding cassette domain-containing protein [Eubacteriales bacterium]|nr:ATP-binding cassette domain-containing protein [Eubacteriales bacterium]